MIDTNVVSVAGIEIREGLQTDYKQILFNNTRLEMPIFSPKNLLMIPKGTVKMTSLKQNIYVGILYF